MKKTQIENFNHVIYPRGGLSHLVETFLKTGGQPGCRRRARDRIAQRQIPFLSGSVRPAGRWFEEKTVSEDGRAVRCRLRCLAENPRSSR